MERSPHRRDATMVRTAEDGDVQQLPDPQPAAKSKIGLIVAISMAVGLALAVIGPLEFRAPRA
jgi:hypothetical protein